MESKNIKEAAKAKTEEEAIRPAYEFVKKKWFYSKRKPSEDKLVNPDTGEMKETMDSVGYKGDYDSQSFIKVYNMSKIFKLSKGGLRVLEFIIDRIKTDQLEVFFSMETCRKACEYKYMQQVTTAIVELLKEEIIFRTDEDYKYLINPIVLFKGERLPIIHKYTKTKLDEHTNRKPKATSECEAKENTSTTTTGISEAPTES